MVDIWTTWVWTSRVHLYMEFFQSMHSTGLHNLQLVESTDEEPWIWRANSKVICQFTTAWRIGIPAWVFKGQLYKEFIQFIHKKQTIQWKNGQRIWINIFQRRHSNRQWAHEKMFNIINFQGNANQNHNKILPHTCKNGYYQKDKK